MNEMPLLKTAPIRVMIVDDHALLREGLRKVLEMEESAITICAEAVDGQDALEKIPRVHPQVVVMDISMPRLNGIEATRRIREQWPEIKVIVLTIHDQPEYFLEVIKAGAHGYVLKDVEPARIVQAIRTVFEGGTYFPERYVSRVVDEYRRLAREEAAVRSAAVSAYELTGREVEILHYLAQGLTNRQIATRLYISEKTVKNHVTNIFRKLGVSDRTQAVIKAVKERLVHLDGAKPSL